MTAEPELWSNSPPLTLDRTLVRESHLQGGNVTGSCTLCLIGVLLAPAGLTAQNSPTAPVSELQLESSDAKLVQVFQWAKSQALAYAHDGSDPGGPWYEAALPGRNSFCMRDVSHQTTGAAALGLYSANLNMLGRFAAAVSPTRDWAGYWEIDRFGHPSAADYVSDDDFWYNLPANFDLLDAAVRMWRWTGNDVYLNDPRFRNFYEKTATAYLKTWDLQPDRVLKRSRIMNQRLREGKFVRARGIPSYTEGREDFNIGTDLLAAEYRAFESLRLVALGRHKVNLAVQYRHTADEIAHLIEHKAWSEEEHHFVGFFSQDGNTQGSGDAMVLYFGATSDPIHIGGALTYIESPEYLKNIGIEEESYLPQIFYHYGEKAAAYERMMDLSSPDKDRREYPEVSFAVISALVSGMMGVETIYDPASGRPLIHSISRLAEKSDIATMKGIRIRQNLVDLEHTGDQESSLTNRSGPPLFWQATFSGKVSSLKVNGRPVRAKATSNVVGTPVSWIIVDVPLGATVVVSRP